MRNEIFQTNFADFEAHNEQFKKGEVTFEKGINQFSDLTPEEFSNLNHGLRAPGSSHLTLPVA